MNYNTMDFNNVLNEIQEEVNRIEDEMNIYNFSHEENVYTYNRLTTILLKLKEIR